MNTDELIDKVSERLNHTGNPALPPEDTLKAIVALGVERDDARATINELEEHLATLAKKLKEEKSRADELEFLKIKAEEEAKNYSWVAYELSNFVRGVANRQFEGQEIPAAQRVFDLNKNSVSRKRLNAFSFDTLEEAECAFVKKFGVPEGSLDNLYQSLLVWLFEEA